MLEQLFSVAVCLRAPPLVPRRLPPPPGATPLSRSSHALSLDGVEWFDYGLRELSVPACVNRVKLGSALEWFGPAAHVSPPSPLSANAHPPPPRPARRRWSRTICFLPDTTYTPMCAAGGLTGCTAPRCTASSTRPGRSGTGGRVSTVKCVCWWWGGEKRETKKKRKW
jgi:hypothetical protein